MTAARIVCVGAGRMGRGIAHVFAYAGHRVTVIDAKPREGNEAARLLAAAEAEVRGDLEFLRTLGVLAEAQVTAILARISWVGREAAEAALAGADFVFEAVREVIVAKRDGFALIAGAAPEAAIVASTTSTLPVARLAELIAGPGRFVNAHWLNPAFLIPLVEVSPGPETADETVNALTALLKAVGKVPVVCAARPGYIVPRLQAVAMNEAARMVEEGVASAEDIDTAIRVGFGIRYAVLGLLEFVDFGGGDILYYASRHLKEALGSERYEMPEIVRRNMEEGKLGLATGQGFYDFRGLDAQAYRRNKLANFVRLLEHLKLMPAPGGETSD